MRDDKGTELNEITAGIATLIIDAAVAAVDEDQLLTTAEVAQLLQLHEDTLWTWRANGTGPPAIVLGRAVRYRRVELRDWVASKRI